MTDIDGLALATYQQGTDAVDWAITIARTHIDVLDAVREARATEPAAFPIYRMELSPESTARQIVGALMDAGWTPPGGAP